MSDLSRAEVELRIERAVMKAMHKHLAEHHRITSPMPAFIEAGACDRCGWTADDNLITAVYAHLLQHDREDLGVIDSGSNTGFSTGG